MVVVVAMVVVGGIVVVVVTSRTGRVEPVEFEVAEPPQAEAARLSATRTVSCFMHKKLPVLEDYHGVLRCSGVTRFMLVGSLGDRDDW